MNTSEQLLIDLKSEEYFMEQALRQAVKAYGREEVPVGAVIVHEGNIIARAHNEVETLRDATAHAEILAITQAAEVLGDWRLNQCDLYVTKEPCPMCAGACVNARISRVVFGCSDPHGGGAGGLLNILQLPTLNHHCDFLAGVKGEESGALLKKFFQKKRTSSKKE
jgi:tRNA(adenine34) deaminase